MSVVGDNLRALREAAGLSQRELAYLTGVSHAAVNRWERGVRTPDANRLVAVARALGVSVGRLVGESPPAESPPTPFPVGEETVEVSTPGLGDKDKPLAQIGRMIVPAPGPTVRLHGHIGAGLGDSDEAPGTLDLFASNWKTSYRGLIVTSDSMAPEIRVGDCVIIDTAREPYDGCVVAAYGRFPEGLKALLKRFHKQRRGFILTSDNPNYKPTAGRSIRILGVCLEIIRQLGSPGAK